LSHYQWNQESHSATITSMSAGVCNLFMFFEPLTAWRHVSVTHRRTAVDYADDGNLVDECYPDALKIRIVHDHFHTHVPASLCKAFALRPTPLDKLEFHYTPKHWQLAKHGRN